MDDNQYTIFSSDENFEKSIKMGYVRNALQQMSFYNKGFSKFEDSKGLVDFCRYTTKKLGNLLVKKVGKGVTARYQFPIPEIVFDLMKTPDAELYKEESLEFAYLASNVVSPYQDLLEKQVTSHCRLKDVVLFKRAFVILDLLLGTALYKQKDRNRIVSSLVPIMSEKQIIDFADRFIEDRTKTKELLDLFTYNPNYKLDLQYTPFLKIGHNYLIPFSLVGKSFLLRNCIEYSYLIKNQIVNQDDKEFLVLECKKTFEKRKKLYTVFTNRKFKYDGRNGEIDVIVISDDDVLIIECKCPLYPTSNFELRGTFDHIKKASSQLDLASKAFNDPTFAEQYFKNLNISYKDRNVRTCVIMGNRLFNGWNIKSHPIRFIYEFKRRHIKQDRYYTVRAYRGQNKDKKYSSYEEKITLRHRRYSDCSILIEGDGTTCGTTSRSYLDVTYPSRLGQLLDAYIQVNANVDDTAKILANRISYRQKYFANYDVICIAIGTNDYELGVPIGSVVDSGLDTFYGTLIYIVEKIKEQNKNAKVVFITPFYRGRLYNERNINCNFKKNKSGHTLEDYADAIKAVADVYRYNVYDANIEGAISLNNISYSTRDYVYPVEEYHSRIACDMVDYFIKNKILVNK